MYPAACIWESTDCCSLGDSVLPGNHPTLCHVSVFPLAFVAVELRKWDTWKETPWSRLPGSQLIVSTAAPGVRGINHSFLFRSSPWKGASWKSHLRSPFLSPSGQYVGAPVSMSLWPLSQRFPVRDGILSLPSGQVTATAGFQSAVATALGVVI